MRSLNERKEAGVSLAAVEDWPASSWSNTQDMTVCAQDRSFWEACDEGPSRARAKASGAMANKGRMAEPDF
jgi:hypothetical protein